MTNIIKTKDPAAKLDYLFDWAPKTNDVGLSDWLEEGETISTYEVTVPTGLTLVSHAKIKNNTAIVAWVSGGTLGNTYDLTCKITTTPNGRIDLRTIHIKIANT
jgi:hypothetical protein